MNREIACKFTQKEIDEAHARVQEGRVAKMQVNHGLLILGKIVTEGRLKTDWEALGYENENDWLTDPHGLDLRPRTANAFAKIWRLWCNRLVKLGLKEQDILTIDHAKLEALADKIEAEPDDNKALVLLETARTQTLRMLQQTKEEEKYFTWYGTGKIHRALSERTGWVKTISQVKPRIQMSVQNFWEIFGNRQVEIRIRYKKEEE